MDEAGTIVLACVAAVLLAREGKIDSGEEPLLRGSGASPLSILPLRANKTAATQATIVHVIASIEVTITIRHSISRVRTTPGI